MPTKKRRLKEPTIDELCQKYCVTKDLCPVSVVYECAFYIHLVGSEFKHDYKEKPLYK